VTDEALASIAIFQEIKELDLTGTQVHDQSLVAIQHLPKLQSLKLKGTQISSPGMTSLTQIHTLVLLDASNTAVADDGLTQASSWTNLRYLSLNNTAVTDASIPHLTSITTLKGLSLLNTRVTAEGAQTLKKALPACLIVTSKELESNPSAAIGPLQPVPSQSDVTFPNFLSPSDPQLEQLAELAGKQPQLAVHLASIYSDREQWSQAARILSAAAAVDPSLQPVQFALGIALARSGDTAAAMAHLTQATGEAEANYNLGQIEYENNLRSCANHFRQAVAADPSLTMAQTRLKEVQRELAGLKQQQRTPVHAATYRSSPTVDVPLEIIPAPPVRSAGLSQALPR
jgi:tetratricopeptide (TPR) repeat protein